MLRDLSKAEARRRSARADVVVVGSGLAGLVLATYLSRRGLRVVVLESGAEMQASPHHPLNEVVQRGQIHRGAEAGRFRCLGGTSTRWGGAMLPFLPCDMGPHTAGWDVDWPVSIDDVAGEFEELEGLFRLPAGPFELDGETSPLASEHAFLLRSAKWPKFRLRNVAQVFRKDVAGAGLEIWLNATVTRFRLDDSGRLAALSAVSPSSSEISVEAPIFVVAAGAIESTRLLLLLDAQHDDRIFAPDDVLGRYFHDHLAAPAAEITPIDDITLNATFGKRFEGSGIRDRRLEPTAALRAARGLPGGFAQVRATSSGEDGFAALRGIYRDVQRRSPPKLRDVAALMCDFEWFAQAAWWRFAKGRLLAPRRATFELLLMIEQMPHAENRITLSSDRSDRNGNPLAQIDWRVRDPDIETFRAMQSALTAYWAESTFASLGALTPTPEGTWRGRLFDGADHYHPGGSTRIGVTPSSGVLDAELKTFRVDNLYVVSTSAFPSGGGTNPSFTLMAFALRTAKRIARELRYTAE